MSKLQSIQLQAPDMSMSMTLMDALRQRRTNRDFASTPLSDEHLSGLFWAAYGANREDGRKTVPAAWGLYALRLFAITPQAAYAFDPQSNTLNPIKEGDFRAFSGMQDFVTHAPLDIAIFVDDDMLELSDKDMNKIVKKNKDRVAALDAGAVTQNIYLYCAAAGLNAVERLMVGEDDLKKVLKLGRHQHYVVGMTIGYPQHTAE